MECKICGKNASEILPFCVDCIREGRSDWLSHAERAHKKVRENFNLPSKIPKSSNNSIKCNLCSNECSLGKGEKSYCGLRMNENGKLKSLSDNNSALLYSYFDLLPTNCCSAWFCAGSKERRGYYNLAVFFYGCNFNCLFCQNSSHKRIGIAEKVTVNELVERALNSEVKCVCYFGGSPEPQLQFAINASRKILEKEMKKICWEWNGCGNSKLVKKAAELSFESNGNIKFDLKTWNENLSYALSGVSNKKAYENFEFIAKEFFDKRKEEPILTATTLLVPYYVDKEEVEGIAKFISSFNEEIPYSLLVFHPSFYMQDLPITSKKQVQDCYITAKKYLKRVNIGNKHLLWGFL